jgi:hypothetical protein
MGDAQASADEANMNYDMQSFYMEFLNKIRDDQLRYDGNHANDTGALADVVPFDGIGGNPGCPVWQVAYIVLARQALKHYGDGMLPSIKKHWVGLTELIDWFDRHADPKDGLLVTHCYGDWMGFNPESGNGGGSKFTPPPLITSFYHVLAQEYMAEMATAIGDSFAAGKYRAAHSAGQRAWHARFYNEEAGGYAPCSSAGPPKSKLQCPEGQKLDSVSTGGDDGSCDCDEFCATDWAGSIKKARPHWTGAASAVAGAKTDCACVQASHWCPKDQEHGCQHSCSSQGLPTPQNYCVPNSLSADICHGTSKNGSQASNSLGLALGAPPDKATAERIAKNLRDDVVAFGNKTTTGVVGIAFLFPMLDQFGYGDIGLATLLNDDYPSLGHMVRASRHKCAFLILTALRPAPAI